MSRHRYDDYGDYLDCEEYGPTEAEIEAEELTEAEAAVGPDRAAAVREAIWAARVRVSRRRHRWSIRGMRAALALMAGLPAHDRWVRLVLGGTPFAPYGLPRGSWTPFGPPIGGMAGLLGKHVRPAVDAEGRLTGRVEADREAKAEDERRAAATAADDEREARERVADGHEAADMVADAIEAAEHDLAAALAAWRPDEGDGGRAAAAAAKAAWERARDRFREAKSAGGPAAEIEAARGERDRLRREYERAQLVADGWDGGESRRRWICQAGHGYIDRLHEIGRNYMASGWTYGIYPSQFAEARRLWLNAVRHQLAANPPGGPRDIALPDPPLPDADLEAALGLGPGQLAERRREVRRRLHEAAEARRPAMMVWAQEEGIFSPG